MLSSSKKKNTAHRVRCVCQTFECYLGQYVDAYGINQRGVEVLPDTLAAHQLADRAAQATARLSTQRLPSNPLDLGSHTPGQDGLISAISGLRLNTMNPTLSHASSSLRLVLDGKQGSDDKPKESLPSSKTCLAATEAKAAGMDIYKCGELINLAPIHPCSIRLLISNPRLYRPVLQFFIARKKSSTALRCSGSRNSEHLW